MKLADALVTTLRDFGIRHLFGVSGANIEHVHDAVHRLGGNRLQSVLTKSEVGAAFMADARGRIHGELGVCCSTSGGGMMNLAVGLAESYADGVPVLAIVGQSPSMFNGLGAFQDTSGSGATIDARTFLGSITKRTELIDDPALFWSELEEALRAALTGRHGPAALLVPRNIFDLEVPEKPDSFPRRIEDIRDDADPCNNAISSVLRALNAAHRPLVIAGAGLARSKAHDAFSEFVSRTNIRVATTMANPAAFDNDHSNYIGMIGASGHPSAHEFVTSEPDLILAVGSELDLMTRAALGDVLDRVPVVLVGPEIEAAARVVAPVASAAGELDAVFSALLSGAHDLPHYGAPSQPKPPSRYLPRTTGDESTEDVLLQSDALSVLQNHLPESGHVLFDAGNCAAAALHYLTFPKGVTTTIALGMGGMGYSIAGALGAQIEQKTGDRTLVICGDGAFMMVGSEIHTAVEHGLNILFVIFNNNKHGMCNTRQHVFFDGREEASIYAPVNCAQVAQGFGAEDKLWVGTARTRAEMEICLRDYGRGAPRPGVLELVLPVDEMPPFTPFLPDSEPTFVPQTYSAA